MSTNYYLKRNKPADLTEFVSYFDNDWDSFMNHVDAINNDEYHLGKTSAGWRFLFREHDEYHNFDEFKHFLDTVGDRGQYKDYHIEDEYGVVMSKEELLQRIAEHQKEPFRYGDGTPAETEPADHLIKVVDGYRFADHDFS